jgi:hypothetical protein
MKPMTLFSRPRHSIHDGITEHGIQTDNSIDDPTDDDIQPSTVFKRPWHS